jgi:hypothetical protein
VLPDGGKQGTVEGEGDGGTKEGNWKKREKQDVAAVDSAACWCGVLLPAAAGQSTERDRKARELEEQGEIKPNRERQRAGEQRQRDRETERELRKRQ